MILETPRLRLRRMTPDDAAFMLRLLNEPAFLRFIGDKGVRTTEDARRYILDGPIRSYATHGFGLFITESKADGIPIGICGLVKREWLDEVDVGFAFLPEYWSKGYGSEAATAVVCYAREKHGMKRLLAITSHDNTASQRLLQKLGFNRESNRRIPDDPEEVCMFGLDIAGCSEPLR